MTVRRAVPSDAEALADLHQTSFSPSWAEDYWLGATQSQETTVFCIGERALSGLLAVREIAGEAEILTIAVLPADRKAGLGAQLMTAATAHLEAQGVSKLFLEVAENNLAAKALYSRFGFEKISIRKGYYADGQDALLMVRQQSK